MSRPGESQYGQIRRFLIANHGTKIVFPDEIVSRYRYYKLHHYVRLNEYKFINKCNENGLIKQEVPDNISRPKKWCPKCASIGYHTDLYNLDWVSKCIVHQETLLSSCPKCKKRWRPYGQLLWFNVCTCCGTNLNIKDVVYNSKLDTEAFKTYESVMETLDKVTLKAKFETKLRIYLACSNKWFLDIEQCLSAQAINSFSPFNFSIMKIEELISKFEISSLLKMNVPFIDTCQYIYNLPISKPFNTPSNNGKGIKKILLKMEDEYIRILTNQIIGNLDDNIQESEYILSEGVLATHAPFYILGLLLDRQSMFSNFSSEYRHLRRASHFISELNKGLFDDYLK